MNNKLSIMLLTGSIMSLFLIVASVNAEDNSIKFNSIKSSAPGVTGSSTYLTTYSISGVRNTIYYAFDFSDFPSGATPDFAAFYVKSSLTPNPCNVEAYYFSSADWVQTGSVSNSTILSSTGATNFVSQADEQYAFTSKALIQAVEQACLAKGEFTVCLKAKANAYGDSMVLFYPDATLEITYAKTSTEISSTPTIPECQPATIALLIVMTSIAAATVVYRGKSKKIDP